MKVIIAEKPSLARNITSAIGNMKKADGYFYNDEYFVTWAFGHLFTLADIEDYPGHESATGKWSMDNLPCFPDEFKFNLKKDVNKQVDKGVLKQFNIIKNLCEKDNVDEIVNAGDADREGEVIVRLITNNINTSNKKLTRLWLPDQTEETINEALKDLKTEDEYQNLADEGFARTYIDWLYGVNLTRYATLKTGTLLRVGRVIIPIVKAIYDRDMAIRNFVPDIYYGIYSNELTNNEEILLESKEKFDKDKKNKAEELCNKYNASKAIVIDKKTKKDKLNPGKLYSLSKLQNVLGKKYKMPMDKSLSIVQGLYEKGFLTYPRTNSEYLATAEKDKVKSILKNIKDLGYPVEFKDKKTIFDDSKIESHSALTPTYKIPKKSNLTEDEFTVYQTVFKRFVAVFCAIDCEIEKTEIKIKVGEYEEFNLKGTTIINPGWTKYDDSTAKDKILPNLNVGDEVNINFKPKEKETTPPKHYTIETLNNYLKNPFKEDKKRLQEEENDNDNEELDDSEDYKAIFEGLELGTEATRTGIIDNARKSKYIELKKDTYYIMPDGEYLINNLVQMEISMDKYKTSEMGKALKKVYHNTIGIKDAVKQAEEEIKDIFDKKNDNETTGFYGEVIGKCPKCGNDIIKGKYNYGCKDYKNCKFKIPTVLCGRVISKKEASVILEKGISDELDNFISKKNTTFKAKLKLDGDGVVFDFNQNK